MSEYQKQALDFLEKCNAKIKIEFVCTDVNQNWNDNAKRNKYQVTITTPRGKMVFDFWDSIMNTQIMLTGYGEFIEKLMRKSHDAVLPKNTPEPRKYFEMQKEAKPKAYDVLACLTKYDPGTMNDFFHEFGYEVHSADDMFTFLNTYNAVVKEYRDLCRIFTEEQMEMLREIN